MYEHKHIGRFSNLHYCTFKSHKEYVYNTDMPHVSCLCEICENSLLLVRGLNKQKKFKEKLPNNPHDLNQRFSCNSDEEECMLEKCISCKSSDLIDQIVVVESSEVRDSEDSSNPVNFDPEDPEDIESENNAAKVTFYQWQTIDNKKITKATIEVSFNDAIEMLNEEVVSLKERIHIKRRQVNACREMKPSLTDEAFAYLMVQVDFAESYKNAQQDIQGYTKRILW